MAKSDVMPFKLELSANGEQHCHRETTPHTARLQDRPRVIDPETRGFTPKQSVKLWFKRVHAREPESLHGLELPTDHG